MSQTLDAPVYEVKQDSEWYKYTIERLQRQREFYKTINNEYFKDNGFSYYHSEYFGIEGSSGDYEVYKDELTKKPTKEGVHIFKKKSKYYSIFKEMLEKVGDKDPFKSHDVLGMNNVTASQWIGDRWFFGVKHEQYVTGEEVELLDYKEYLKVVMDSLDK